MRRNYEATLSRNDLRVCCVEVRSDTQMGKNSPAIMHIVRTRIGVAAPRYQICDWFSTGLVQEVHFPST